MARRIIIKAEPSYEIRYDDVKYEPLGDNNLYMIKYLFHQDKK